MKYSALIFDMDGTIVHNMPTHTQAWQDTLAEAGVHINQDEFHRLTTGKKTAEIVRQMLGDTLNDEEVAYWGERKETLYRQRFACCREPLPGLLDLLNQATQKNIPMAVATAAPPENITFILDGLNLRQYFKTIVGATDVQYGKPHPEMFLRAAQLLHTEPAHCLVFEDALGGIEAARRAGMDVILISTTIEAHEVAGQPHVLCAVPDYTSLHLEVLLDGG